MTIKHLRVTIGHNIHRLRAKRKFSLRKLARLSGINLLNLDNYEIGKSEIRLEQLLKLACALEVGLGELVADKQNT